MFKMFNIVILAGVMALQTGAAGIAGDEGSAGPSPAPRESASEKKTSDTAVPLSERKDILYFSDFSKGMNNKGVPPGWNLDDKQKPIDISLVKEGDQTAVRLKSKNSAFGIYKEQDFDIKDYPFLNWEWKVDELPEGGSFLDKNTDDQAAQVYISFGSLSFFNKPFVKAVGYYWSSTVPVGTSGECPTWSKSRVIVLESGKEDLGKWKTEKRNVYEDYKKLFQEDNPSNASALRLYTNSQHTKTGTEASFRNIYFSKN
jgi:hypothetical protein